MLLKEEPVAWRICPIAGDREVIPAVKKASYYYTRYSGGFI
jgi:hypothetical protein